MQHIEKSELLDTLRMVIDTKNFIVDENSKECYSIDPKQLIIGEILGDSYRSNRILNRDFFKRTPSIHFDNKTFFICPLDVEYRFDITCYGELREESKIKWFRKTIVERFYNNDQKIESLHQKLTNVPLGVQLFETPTNIVSNYDADFRARIGCMYYILKFGKLFTYITKEEYESLINSIETTIVEKAELSKPHEDKDLDDLKIIQEKLINN